jgi:hypothetical protein
MRVGARMWSMPRVTEVQKLISVGTKQARRGRKPAAGLVRLGLPTATPSHAVSGNVAVAPEPEIAWPAGWKRNTQAYR